MNVIKNVSGSNDSFDHTCINRSVCTFYEIKYTKNLQDFDWGSYAD